METSRFALYVNVGFENMKKRNVTILTFVALLLGGLIGTVAGVLYTTNLTANTLLLLKMGELRSSADKAWSAYLNEAPATGIWALKNHLGVIKGLHDIGYPEQRDLHQHEVATHFRLALLCGKLEKQEKQIAHLEEAMLLVPKMTNTLFRNVKTKDDLHQLMTTLDEKKLP